MDNFGFSNIRIGLLKRCGRLDQVAEIYLEQGQILAAIDMFMRHSESYPDSLQRAHASLLQGLWQQVSFGAPFAPTESPSHTALDELLTISRVLVNRNNIASHVLDEVRYCCRAATKVPYLFVCRLLCLKPWREATSSDCGA